MANTLRHWLGTKKYEAGQRMRALAYRTHTPWGRRVVADFWEDQAAIIHAQWGEESHDFAVLNAIIAQSVQPQPAPAILDVGCGSGRLFGLYRANGIADVVGLDIAEQALALANERYPDVPTQQGKVEDLDFPADRFTLAICNRVLQHIPPNAIQQAIGKLCTIAQMVYVNELTASDQLNEEFFMFRHAYPALFAQQGLRLAESGQIGQQTYYLFKRT